MPTNDIDRLARRRASKIGWFIHPAYVTVNLLLVAFS
jgi:hypothetical protein